ncbi:MAG: putative toxin-antitoxin system toxin component, PIN family [Deltaproteobacteria bacterium]|nr:putative toxin-antitoxin system toxin component, PIN family [Deltaproteobacteria bacterium]
MKTILDTNVLLSAFLTDGTCARILKRARQKDFSFILCEPVLLETKRLLKNKFSLSSRDIKLFVSILTEAADVVYHPAGVPPSICRDPDDDIILVCAAETESDFLVTGDKDLLVLKAYQGAKIIGPRDFELLFMD